MEMSLILGIIALGLLFAFYLIRNVMARDTGTATMREISDAIKAGAEAFLRRQYRTIVILALALALLIYIIYAFARAPHEHDPAGPGALALWTTLSLSTGSGKTSLINLAARLFDVTSGAVLFDGVDVRELDPDILWHRIGLVPQKPYLFAGTVASNLRYGKPDATDDEIWAALEVAQAADFVREMPGGLNAEIAQGGVNVSGGQRQRLAMARALVRKPDVYLFDDSCSALDLATDARLRAALTAERRAREIVEDVVLWLGVCAAVNTDWDALKAFAARIRAARAFEVALLR